MGVIQGVAEAVGRPDLIMPLMAGVGHVDSAEPSYAMWELSRLEPTGEEFREGFEEFLVEFGSRGPNEWEGALADVGDRTEPCAGGDRPDAATPEAAAAARPPGRAGHANVQQAAKTLLAMVEGDPEAHGQLAAAIACSARLAAGT